MILRGIQSDTREFTDDGTDSRDSDNNSVWKLQQIAKFLVMAVLK